MRDPFSITEADALVDVIAELADEQRARAELIRALAVRAVDELGAPKITTAAAAAVSRPTLDAWLNAKEDKS